MNPDDDAATERGATEHAATERGATERGATEERTGSAADEAVRLVAALRDLVTGPGSEHLATGSAECLLCPFCRLVALLRDADAQSVGRVADSVVSTVSAAASVAEPYLRMLVDTAISTAQSAASRTDEPQRTDSQRTDPQRADPPSPDGPS